MGPKLLILLKLVAGSTRNAPRRAKFIIALKKFISCDNQIKSNRIELNRIESNKTRAQIDLVVQLDRFGAAEERVPPEAGASFSSNFPLPASNDRAR